MKIIHYDQNEILCRDSTLVPCKMTWFHLTWIGLEWELSSTSAFLSFSNEIQDRGIFMPSAISRHFHFPVPICGSIPCAQNKK